MTTISFIVTIYNKSPCIRELVQGLKNQVGDFNREFIFINDGSTDNSLDILYEEVKHLKNFQIISRENQGISRAINLGLSHATGDYVKLVDGDDYLVEDATLTLLQAIRQTGKSVSKGYFSNMPSAEKRFYDGKVTILDNTLKKALKSLRIGSSTSLIETALLKQVGGCDDKIFVQDYSLALRLAFYTDFAVVNKLIAYNIDRSQERSSSNKLREHRDMAIARYHFVKEYDLNDKDKLIAFKAQIAKSWSWYKKNNSSPYFSKYFVVYIKSKFTYNIENEKLLQLMEEACEVYG